MKVPRGAVTFPQNKASWVGGADDNLKPLFLENIFWKIQKKIIKQQHCNIFLKASY